jgi:outer membrane protein OmpA-like peptidoglycan-associated protein
LGYPINDQNNQVSLYVSADGSKGYFSKEEYEIGKPLANQSNIWTFEVPPELKLGHRSNYVKGRVFNNLTKEPISAHLKLINLESGELKGHFKSGLLDGKYLVVLNEGSEYAFYAETPGYLFKSIRFDYSEKEHIEPIEMDIYLDPIIKGITVQLSNIYFETGKAVLLSKSKVELRKLYELMKQNPTLKIELGGHTDNTGSESTNQVLSQKRVNAVKSYLVSAGISSSRIVGKGYGEAKPVATTETAEGRKKHRRVEFTVL